MDFATRLMDLISQKGINKLQLSKDIGVSSSLISAWVKGGKTPSTENIIALADYFFVTTDYLLCRSEVRPSRDSVSLSAHEKRLLDAFRVLEEDEQLIELGRIELMADMAIASRKKQPGVG